MSKDTTSNCIFCQIALGEQKSFTVYEDEKFIAFLDKRPLFLGHTLLIPKDHANTFYDVPPPLIKPFFTLAQKVGKAVETGMEADGSFMAMNNTISQSVLHFHIHIIPRNQGDGLHGFFWPRQAYLDEKQIIEVRDNIRSAM